MTMPPTPPSVHVDIGVLTEPSANPNHMDSASFDLLVEAIKRVGFLQPVLVRELPDGTLVIVDGVHRVRAAKAAGLAQVSAVVVDTDEAQAAILQIGMNKMRGELNLSQVSEAMAALVLEGYPLADLTLTGFSSEEVDDLLAMNGKRDGDDPLDDPPPMPPDDVPAVDRPFALELTFTTATDLKKARRGLKKAIGKGGNIGDGLLRLLEGA